MEIKGTAVKTIPEFVKENFTSRYVEWIKALSEDSREIATGVKTSTWYPMDLGGVALTQKVGELFYAGNIKQCSWELGRYSADVALNGIYKLYVKVSSPGHIISRASRVFSAYYKPSTMQVAEHRAKSVKLIMTAFDQPNVVIEYRIAGWIERALEISGCKDVVVEIPKSLTKGHEHTTFACNWK